MMQQSVMIFGAESPFGSAAMDAFWNAGWHVIACDTPHGNLDDTRPVPEVIVLGIGPTPLDRSQKDPHDLTRIVEMARKAQARILVPRGMAKAFGPLAKGLDLVEMEIQDFGPTRARVTLPSLMRETLKAASHVFHSPARRRPGCCLFN